MNFDFTKTIINGLKFWTKEFVEEKVTTSEVSSKSYTDNKISEIDIPEQIQPDWNQTDETQVDYIKNKPTLSQVATSGSYNDLSDKPEIPELPTLSTVATSGSYNDLSDKPEGIATEEYVTEATTALKNDILNGAGEAYDTLKELGDLIDENTDALEALETVATNKQDKITGTAGQFVVIGDDGDLTAVTIPFAEGVSF